MRITFKLPANLIAVLIVRRVTMKREYRLILIMCIICTVPLWVLAIGSEFQFGYLLAALLFSVVAFFYPIGIRLQANRISKSMPGVLTDKTWEFTSDEIRVTNQGGQCTHSPWNIINSIEVDDKYCYLVVKDGGRSPIPLDLLGAQGLEFIKNCTVSQMKNTTNKVVQWTEK